VLQSEPAGGVFRLAIEKDPSRAKTKNPFFAQRRRDAEEGGIPFKPELVKPGMTVKKITIETLRHGEKYNFLSLSGRGLR
jgi:hypothetical protein